MPECPNCYYWLSYFLDSLHFWDQQIICFMKYSIVFSFKCIGRKKVLKNKVQTYGNFLIKYNNEQKEISMLK